MVLKVYNSLSKKKEIFKPLNKEEVGIYTCGPTVYSYQHIGNLRSYLFPDILKRVLKVKGYRVKQIINVTDVGHLTSDGDFGEDKVEKAIKKEGKSAKEITTFYFNNFEKDLKKMNIECPSKWTWATKHIKEMMDLIKILEKKGYTYKTSDGIYFDTSKFKDYGKLGNLNLKDSKVSERICETEKKSKNDFALWKFSKKGERQQEWDSPWGNGFPGWHIECSAMAMKYLGKTIDIHTGGVDHIPIHHQNEIAQSESATGKKFVNYWMHGAFLIFQGKKISKSEGGLYTLEELEKKGYCPEDLRYFFLSAHYRKPLSFSLKNLDYAKNTLNKLRDILERLSNTQKKKNAKNISNAFKQFMIFMNDDLNTPRALSYLWEILRDNRLSDFEKYEIVLEFDKILGLNLGRVNEIKICEEIQKLLDEREKLRKEGKFIKADEIRKDIEKRGYKIEDFVGGCRLKKSK